MVCPKGDLEFFPSDNMSIRLHGIIVVPQMRALPRSCWATKRVLFASKHGTESNANLDSMVRSHASASRGSSVLWKSGGCVLKKS
jgi:hypothetical protein